MDCFQRNGSTSLLYLQRLLVLNHIPNTMQHFHPFRSRKEQFEAINHRIPLLSLDVVGAGRDIHSKDDQLWDTKYHGDSLADYGIDCRLCVPWWTFRSGCFEEKVYHRRILLEYFVAKLRTGRRTSEKEALDDPCSAFLRHGITSWSISPCFVSGGLESIQSNFTKAFVKPPTSKFPKAGKLCQVRVGSPSWSIHNCGPVRMYLHICVTTSAVSEGDKYSPRKLSLDRHRKTQTASCR